MKGKVLKLSESIISISYFKAIAAQMIEDANKNKKTFVITQNGEAKVVVQDIKVFENSGNPGSFEDIINEQQKYGKWKS